MKTSFQQIITRFEKMLYINTELRSDLSEIRDPVTVAFAKWGGLCKTFHVFRIYFELNQKIKS